MRVYQFRHGRVVAGLRLYMPAMTGIRGAVLLGFGAFTTTFVVSSWQGMKESNPHDRFWRPAGCHYINPL